MSDRVLRIAFLCTVGAGASSAQEPLLAPAQVNDLCARMGSLMEAGGVAIPDLQRAAAPVIENTKQNCVQLRARPGRGDTTFGLLTNLRSFLALSDSVPKPFPFPEAAQKQLAELRDDAARLDAHFRAVLETRERQLLNPDPANLARYAEANRKLGNPSPAKPRVVFFGDSITDFWRLNEYFTEGDYVNRGISGQISGQLLQRVKADVLDLRPQAVVILIGTNDLARGVTPAVIQANNELLADIAAANKIKVVISSLLPVSDYHKADNPVNERTPQRPPASILAINERLKAFASQRGYAYIDYHGAMVDPAGRFKEDLSDDGLHPNGKGYRVMAPLVAAAIDKMFVPPAPVQQQPPQQKKRSFPLFGK